MRLYQLLLFVFIIYLSGCAKKYPISGNLQNYDGAKQHKIYLIHPADFDAVLSSYMGKIIDSARIDKNGAFHFELQQMPADNALLILALQPEGEKFANKLNTDDLEQGNFFPIIFTANHQIQITADSKHILKTAAVKSADHNSADIVTLIQNYFILHQKYLADSSAVDEHNLIEREGAELQFRKSLVESTYDKNNFTLSALAIRLAAPNGDYERMAEIIKATCATFHGISDGDPMYHQLCDKSKTLPLVPGDNFPTMTLPMLGGGSMSTAALWNNTLTLFDFWATWCAPCRKENVTTLVPLWSSAHGDGFQIVGYALDSSEKGWRNAIVKDGVDKWPNASHLQGDESPLFESLHIITIPSNYLVDKNGVIVAKNLHGSALVSFVNDYLQKHK